MRTFRSIITLAAAVLAPFICGAEEIPYREGEKPPVSGPEECWCVITIPPVYTTETIQVCVEPARCSFEVLPAVYETRFEKVCVRPESQRPVQGTPEFRTEKIQVCVKPEVTQKEYVPPVFETREETLCVRPSFAKSITVPPVYKEVTEQVCVQPASSGWRQVECQEVSVSLRPSEAKDACWCFVSVPAKYETVTRKVLAESEKCLTETLPPEYKTIRKQVLVKPESWREIRIPAVYETVERQVLCATPTRYETVAAEYKEVQKQICVQPESRKQVQVPARFESRTREVLVTPARKVWRKVSCKGSAGQSTQAPGSTDLIEGEPSRLPPPFAEVKPKPAVTKLSLPEVPAAVTETARNWAPDAQWMETVEVETIPGKAPVYVLTGNLDGQSVSVKIGANGAIVKADRLPEKASSRSKE